MQGPVDKGCLLISDVQKICQTLSGLLEKGFGPNALNTMLCSSSGTVMITSAGMPVLSSLHLSHPVGRMIVDSISKHHSMTGDNSKTFVFLLAEILRLIDHRLCVSAMRSKEMQTVERFKLIKGFNELKQQISPNVIIPFLLKHSHITCLTRENMVGQVRGLCKDVATTFMAGKLNQWSAAHLSDLVVELLFGDTGMIPPPNLLSTIQECIDNVETLCIEVPGQVIPSSRIVNGVLIQREFQHFDSSLVETCNPVRFVLLGFDIGGESEAPAHQPIFQANSQTRLSAALDWKHKYVETFLKTLQHNGMAPTVILSSQKLDALTVFLCRKLAISCVQMIPEEDMERLSMLSGLQIIHSVMDTSEKDVIATAKYCRKYNVGGRTYIHLSGMLSPGGATNQLEKQLLICAPSPGVCHQMKRLIHNAFKCLRAVVNTTQILNHLPKTDETYCDCGKYCCPNPTLSPRDQKKTSQCHSQGTHRHAISSPGGGTIELGIHLHLKSQSTSKIYHRSSNTKLACDILSDALLTIPLRLLQNSYAPQASRLSTAELLHLSGRSHALGQLVGVNAKSGLSLLRDDHVVEPLCSKISMLYGLLDLVQQLLRTDHIVSVSKHIKPLLEKESDSSDDDDE